MEELSHFLQTTLSKNFGFEDNTVVDALQVSMEELRKAKMDTPPRPPDSSEIPSKPFGLFVPPSVEQILGRRTIESEKDLLSGKRKSIKEMQHPSIPADGGPTALPVDDELSFNGPVDAGRKSTSPGKSSTSTEVGNTSRASYGEYQSSRTSHRATSEESGGGPLHERPLSSHSGTTTNALVASPKALNSSQLSITEANELLEKQEKEESERQQKAEQEKRTSPSQNSTSDYDNMENNMDGSNMYEKNLENTLESVELNNTRNRSEYGEHVSVIDVTNYPSPPTKYHSPTKHSRDYPSPSKVSNHSYHTEFPSPSGRQSQGSHRSPTGGVPDMYRADGQRFLLMTGPSSPPRTPLQMNGSVDHIDGSGGGGGGGFGRTHINGYHHQQQYAPPHKAYSKVPRSQTSPIIDASQPLVLTTAPIDARPAYKSSVYL